MCSNSDLTEIKSSLLSRELGTQIEALTGIESMIDDVLRLAVAGLAVSSNPAIYADRLSRMGVILKSQLRQAITSLAGEARFHAGALLLFLGDRTHVVELLKEIERAGPNELIAASKLASAGVYEAAPLIISRLESLSDEFYGNSKNAPYIQPLLNSLAILKVDVPGDLSRRIKKVGSRYLGKAGP